MIISESGFRVTDKSRSQRTTRRKRRLLAETLERRLLLAGDDWMWFRSFEDVPRVPIGSLSDVAEYRAESYGPHDLIASEWIIQLTEEVTKNVRSLEQLHESFDQSPSEFEIVSGLGSPGSLLLRGRGVTQQEVWNALDRNPIVQHFVANGIVEGQASPNDPEFQGGLQSGLSQIDAEIAWNDSVGSSQIVVGVVDGGIDATHPDLYLNIWLNQGEIPSALRDQLFDIDNDGLITFYDLNNLRRDDTGILVASTGVPATVDQLTIATPFANGMNGNLVTDMNRNGRIDVIDLLQDVRWADGRDTDGNTFFDDLFGVNFRSGNGDPFPNNQPLDELGHGTHVSGTIGAIGDNGFGTVGVNWQTSLMSLRILDNNNQSDAAAAIRAINYAKSMRSSLRFNDQGRVERGADVKVLNNSWGQPGGFVSAFEAAIKELENEGILFVAAAGNGNVLGEGVDNDTTPFYPAGYDADNVIAVAALSLSGDRLARFSNFGLRSVDIAAPGVSVRSTLPGGGIGLANGTSMATPHVTGTAALIWSAQPGATVAEIKQAILTNGTALNIGNTEPSVASDSHVNAAAALAAGIFAPAATLVAKQDIKVGGGATNEFTVTYVHRNGIDVGSVGNDDLSVTRLWGTEDLLAARLKPGSISTDGRALTATYIVDAPNGRWDPLSFGDYQIQTLAGGIRSTDGAVSEQRVIGSFNVRVQDASVIYVDTQIDSPGSNSLREAIISANAAPGPMTIILDTGRFTIDIPHQVDPTSMFPDPDPRLRCGAPENQTGWSDETSGDFDITGSITIVGNQNDLTILDGSGLDRVFKVHPDASLTLRRVTVQGGVSPPDQGGGGILSAGSLVALDSIIRGNQAFGATQTPIRGGGVAAWEGEAVIVSSWITENESDFGGGLFTCGNARGDIIHSAITDNIGGGTHSHSDSDGIFVSSTFSANLGGQGAIFNGKKDGAGTGNQPSSFPATSGDGRYVAFVSSATNLVPNDNNGLADVFVYDRIADSYELVSVSNSGIQANAPSSSPSISADGRFIAFASDASTLVADDTNGFSDVFVFDRLTSTIERVSVRSDGGEAIQEPQQRFLFFNGSVNPSISADGNLISFGSAAQNLVSGDTNELGDIFVHDRRTGETERVSVPNGGSAVSGFLLGAFHSAISDDGLHVAFASDAANLVSGDTNGLSDVFVFDRQLNRTERVSVSNLGAQGNDESFGRLSISGDGRFVAFASLASNLVAGDTNNQLDVYVYDRIQDSIERVSVSDQAIQGNGESRIPSISADGRFVAFDSEASTLVPGDQNAARDVFVFDRQTDSIQRVSVDQMGAEAKVSDGSAGFSPSISSDGRVVTFGSSSDDLIPGDANAASDIFSYDLITQQTGPVTSAPVVSRIMVDQATIARTSGSNFSVSGPVELRDVLFSQENIFPDSLSVQTTNVVQANEPLASRIGPLTRTGDEPPYHPLLSGNPAIDNGSPIFEDTFDQREVIRVIPDIGAYEANSASVSGRVFFDANENRTRDASEPGLANVEVLARLTGTPNTQSALSTSDNPATSEMDEQGRFEFADVPPGTYDFEVTVPDGWTVFESKLEFIEAGQTILLPSVSGDGRFVAFLSFASNLVPNDTNNNGDIFVYDRDLDLIERVSIASDGTQGNGFSLRPSISADGRFVAFSSDASNLVPEDNDNSRDIFLFDRQLRTTTLVSVTSDDSQSSIEPRISGDGNFIAYLSGASDLVPNDNNGVVDVFVYDWRNGVTERVSISSDGTEAESGPFSGGSTSPAINFDGNVIAFVSSASNLVPDDTDFTADVFVRDRRDGTTRRVNVTNTGEATTAGASAPTIDASGSLVAFASGGELVPGSNGGIFVHDLQTGTTEVVSPDAGSQVTQLSGDGRFVLFASSRDDLVPGDTNEASDVFVVDRQNNQISRVSVGDDGQQAENFPEFGGGSSFPAISGDGSVVAFSSSAATLNPDNESVGGLYLAPNRLLLDGGNRTVSAGDVVNDVDFALIPNPGSLSGRVFLDEFIANAVFDQGETTLPEIRVFLDANRNRTYDRGETFVLTDADGQYRFEEVPSFRDYSIVASLPSGLTPLLPGSDQGFVWDVFLPPAGSVTGRDFALTTVSGGGQSRSSSVAGRVFEDRNENGTFEAEVDRPLTNTVVFLDSQNLGTRDENEPAVVTDSEGRYEISNLGASIASVTTLIPTDLELTSPLGSDFELTTTPLFDEIRPFGNPQAIVAADFNQDTFPDVAIALSEANQISIRLNDGQGGFRPEQIDIDLGSVGSGPTSIVVGQFNGDSSGLDLAVANNLSSTVTILKDFEQTGFRTQQTVNVSGEPLDIVAAPVAGDLNHLDLVVVSQADHSLQLLTNDGSGNFSVGPSVATGGLSPVAIVAGEFSGGDPVDLAVLHTASSSSDTPFGDVRILSGDGTGDFTLLPQRLLVGANPTDLVVGQLDNDPANRLDLAVSNFGSNTISILTGTGEGTFDIQPQVIGTASGAFDIATADIDNDGDLDLVASNLLDRNISIFRNTTKLPGTTSFAPLEAVGLGQFGIAQRMPLTLANFDQDIAAPNGSGTIDILAIPTQTDTLHLLQNHLVDGAHRVTLTGLNQVSDLDHIVRPATLPPTLDPIANPETLVEDAGLQMLALSGIAKGRIAGAPLRIVAESSNPALIDAITIEYVDGQSTANLFYTPVNDSSGTAEITVTIFDAGADGFFDMPTSPSSDDVALSQSFTVTVRPVNDPPTLVIPLSIAITQDSGMQIVPEFATQISPGGGIDESTQLVSQISIATDREEAFLSSPTVDSLGALSFEVRSDFTGTIAAVATITDNGGRQNGGRDETRTNFQIVVAPASDPSAIILEGSGNTFFLDQPNAQLDGIQLIDIRGSGDNTLRLSANRIREVFANGEILVVSDAGDNVIFDAGWQFDRAEIVDDQLIRRFQNAGAVLDLLGPSDFANPIDSFDVNASGEVTALDALQVINELSRRAFSDSGSSPPGAIREINEINVSNFRFYDVSADGRISALDALRVINELGRRANSSVSEFVDGDQRIKVLNPNLVDDAIGSLF